ncbi:MAG: hypothetical protein AXA67_09380 [Methylothermaceae bacteria B42]|nr:MAG: hypothetical protein AXA67_09380 [Methylothermaceae bacteria B42]HHJ39517.1 hypothetical protein [Methylothermaceae bacterium]
MTDPNQLCKSCADFLAQRHSAILATTNTAGIPYASYAPSVCFDGDIYIFVSELATHTRNLMETGQASLLFIEDEAQAPQPFARRRLNLQCKAEEVTRKDTQFSQVMPRFRETFGPVIDVLLNLNDFHLFCLHPYQGCYIEGFGRAFELEQETLRQICLN